MEACEVTLNRSLNFFGRTSFPRLLPEWGNKKEEEGLRYLELLEGRTGCQRRRESLRRLFGRASERASRWLRKGHFARLKDVGAPGEEWREDNSRFFLKFVPTNSSPQRLEQQEGHTPLD